MGQYCFACWRLSSSVTLPAGRQASAGNVAVGRPTLHGGPVRLCPIRTTRHVVAFVNIRCCPSTLFHRKMQNEMHTVQRLHSTNSDQRRDNRLDGTGFTQFYLPPTHLSTNGMSHLAYIS